MEVRELTPRTRKFNSGRGTVYLIPNWKQVSIFLDSNAAVAGTARVRVRTDYALTGAVTTFGPGTQAGGGTTGLGAVFKTITVNAAVREIRHFGPSSSMGLGSRLWVDWSLSSGGEVTLGVTAVMRE